MSKSRFVQRGFMAAFIGVTAVGAASVAAAVPVQATMPAGTGVTPSAVVTRTVDCTTPVAISRVYVWIEPTDTVDVTFSNCTHGWKVVDSSGATVRSGASTSGIETLQPLQYIRFFDNAGSSGSRLRVYANSVYPETVPSGERQLVEDITIPVDALEMNIGPVTPSLENHHNLGGLATCKLGLEYRGVGFYFNQHVYGVLSITVTKPGTYTFRGVSTNPTSSYLDSAAAYNPIRDPFLALYEGFDSSQPDVNIVGCNDDLNDLFGYADTLMGERLPDGSIMDGHQPYFVVELQPGDYELVLTTYLELSAEFWADQGYGPATTTFEMWGPIDSLCLREDACGGGGETPSFDIDWDHYLSRAAEEGALPGTR